MPKRALYPGQLPTWRLESTKPKTKAKREPQTKRVKELASIRQHNFRARIISNHDVENAKAMEEMEELASYRYFGFHGSANFTRLEELDRDFQGTLKKEHNWPTPLANPKDVYSLFYDATHALARNIICASCGTLRHDFKLFTTVKVTDPKLEVLRIPETVYVPFDFSCGINVLDSQRIMVDKLAISDDHSHGTQIEALHLCNTCHKFMERKRLPPHSLANYRWVGTVPEELQGLTWLEELLVARAHLVGRVIRLEERKATSYFALKGHTILLPQDTTRLLDLLPMSPSSLPEVVKVVWTGKSMPEKQKLRTHFTVRKRQVYDALQWLCRNHEDYRQVTIDEERLASWESTFVATDILDSMNSVANNSLEDASRSGFATEDPDNNNVEGDIPHSVSGMIDVTDVGRSMDAEILRDLAEIKTSSPGLTVNVVTGNSIISDFYDSTYFTSAFPTLFPYGTGKHIDARRTQQLGLSTWLQLLLRDSSRLVSCHISSALTNIIGVFSLIRPSLSRDSTS
ncbi:MAG: hypothetical protein E6H10_15205 [Bacteroidetes bacterium]|jgi:hypothetical protein|nr:MAG: hypothetical protein E6H10_15205 [Bacteroidota bacterium]